jgi:hypothetical protein
MLQNQTPEYYSNPFIFGIGQSKLVPIFINAAPTAGEQFYFYADEDLNGKTIKGINIADVTAVGGDLFPGYTILTLDFAKITLTIAGSNGGVVINDLPVSILSIANNVLVPGRGGKKFKTKIKMNLSNSFIRFNAAASTTTYPAVLPFIFYY